MISRFRLWIGLVLIVSIIIAVSFFWFSKTTNLAVHSSNHVADKKEMIYTPEKIQNNTLTLNPEQLQSIGVTFALAKKQLLEKNIRTVGRVETDERKIVSVNIKVSGWIEKLLVNSTGEYVKKGQPLFTIYSPELMATEQEYLLALEAAKKLKKSSYAEVSQGASSLLNVTRQRLQLWDVTDQQIKELEQTGKVPKTLVIYSPIAGTVIKKMALAGMQINPGDLLYIIADLSQVWVLADIYENEVPDIRVGRTATMTLSSAPNTILQGRISFIYPTVHRQTRTIKVRLEFDNPHELLKPGMYANVALKIPLGMRLVIPADAVLESGERSLVFVYLGNGQLEWREVKTGVKTDDWIEILEGVKEGEKVVASANFLLDSESQLKAAVGGMKH